MNSDIRRDSNVPQMKKRSEGKSVRTTRASSQSVALDSTPRCSGQPHQRKHTTGKTSPRTVSESSNELERSERSISGLGNVKIEGRGESKEEENDKEKNKNAVDEKKIAERPESPPNPYNKTECQSSVQWPGETNREYSSVNGIEFLECRGIETSPLENCSCSLTEKNNDGCCKADVARKKLYCEIKARVERAFKKHKIFLIRGELLKLSQALEERGWVQKYESVKTRMVPYGSVVSLESKSMANIKNVDGTINEKALIFALLRHNPPDFIWDCRNDFTEWDSSLRSNVILNRLQRSYIYTSKLGMAHILQDSHWLCEANVASVQYPRSYNVSRESDAFLSDYRINACTGLLKWYVGRVEKGEAFLDLGVEPIAINQLEFALERCEEFLAEARDNSIDVEVDCEKRINDEQWNSFLDDYSRVLHRGNGIAKLRNFDGQSRFEKCYIAATEMLKLIKVLDPQYELNGMRNIWILKPSDLCCGSGISISHNLKDIMRRVEGKPKDYFVVQKYIETPLLIKETKFDIRVWYLITDTFPLTIWIFEEALLRFSSKPYTFSTYHEAIHICNTAVQQKYCHENRRRLQRRNNQLGYTDERMHTTPTVAESIRDQEWDCAKLNEYLKNVGYTGEPYYDEMYPKMSQAIVLTMLASQEYMDKRRCSFELYGADFMVMDDLSVWLIEINTNPRMNPPSSRITQRLYDAVLESLVKVTMDLPMNPAAETGGFRLAYRQNVAADFQPYFGPCLFVFGKRMTLHDRSPENREKIDEARDSNICYPWKKQDRAWTAPPSMPRSRDPKVVDFIEYLERSRCSVAR